MAEDHKVPESEGHHTDGGEEKHHIDGGEEVGAVQVVTLVMAIHTANGDEAIVNLVDYVDEEHDQVPENEGHHTEGGDEEEVAHVDEEHTRVPGKVEHNVSGGEEAAPVQVVTLIIAIHISAKEEEHHTADGDEETVNLVAHIDEGHAKVLGKEEHHIDGGEDVEHHTAGGTAYHLQQNSDITGHRHTKAARNAKTPRPRPCPRPGEGWEGYVGRWVSGSHDGFGSHLSTLELEP